MKLFPFLLISYLFLISLDSAIFGVLLSPLYAMRLSNCDLKRIRGYHEADWRFVLGRGLCPPSKDLDPSRDIKIVYSHCIPWTSDIWETIDTGNTNVGFPTNIANNANNWLIGFYLYLVTASCYAFSIVTINIGVLLQSTMGENDNNKPSKEVERIYFWMYICYNGAVIAMVVGYAAWIAGIYMIHTAGGILTPKYWETYYYESCSVHIYDLGNIYLDVFGTIIPLIQLGLLVAYVSQFNAKRIDFVANQFASVNDFGDFTDTFSTQPKN